MATERCKGCGKGIETAFCRRVEWKDRHDNDTFRRTGLCCDCLHKSDPDSLECKPEDASDDCDVICPWCGYAYQAECTDYGEYEKELECMRCERGFTLYEFHTVTYHTKAQKHKSKGKAVSVEKVGQDEKQKLHVTCTHCGAILEFYRSDVKTQLVHSGGEYCGSFKFIDCPQCKSQVNPGEIKPC